MTRILSIALALFTFATASAARSPEAEAVIRILASLYGQNTLSASIANVDWNTTEAENVYRWTGRYPAVNTFDFIHYAVSADVVGQSWINYADITPVSRWWQQGGLVSCMWHWNQPNNAGTAYTCTPGTAPGETSFDPAKALDPTSPEHAKIVADLDQIASYLGQMQSQAIPVIWRPLHEAAGNTNAYPGGTAWFWWGTRGPEVFRQLWQFVHTYLTETHGLNNLIWVWNGSIHDDDWYPGSAYVDIVSIDYYGSDLTQLTAAYRHLAAQYPDKPAALAECGHDGDHRLPSLQSMWQAGCLWLYAMPWYDYHYNAAQSPDPATHDYHQWFVDAMSQPYVVDRSQMKQLLAEALAGDTPSAITSLPVPHALGSDDRRPASGKSAYSLSGQPVGNAHKGVVIRGGKKHLK